MEMEAAGEDTQFGASTSDPTTTMIRGKRTKRHRSASPPPLKSSTSTTTSSNSGIGGGVSQRSASYAAATTTTTSSGSAALYESSTEEEEDMANCLILLAQGRRRHVAAPPPERKTIGSRRFSDIATTTNRAGFFVYECKTCNRSFPSFQALGGHRASHKRPRPAPGPLATEDKNVIAAGSIPACQVEISSSTAVVVAVAAELRHQNPAIQSAADSDKTAAAATTAGIKSAKVHECAICGAEFASGQALGGHMRRHRASNAGNQAATANAAATVNCDGDLNSEQRNPALSLDLNLPAPEDLDAHQHHRGDPSPSSSKFQFASKAAMVFSAPALVGCHY
ncbi:unnamed protein product [Linum tenue]|uniref:C2H2-type domain-containing protein n=1 Tax=Linum tenue TaxID=586396 RepID=A0AAV0IM69_9ROSI|nr:unnamed protein product [Linum tenue]